MGLIHAMFAIATIFLAVAKLTNAQANANCESYGINLVNGGTYYFNLASTTPFSFISGFSQCSGTTTPILQFPDGTQYTCSLTDLDLGTAETLCPLTNGDFLAGGQYIIYFPEIGTARGFFVVNSQVIITETSTLTATATVTPVATLEELITNTVSDTDTLPTPTTTLPAATKGTLTLSPMTTITTTHSTIRTFFVTTTILTTSTITKSPTPFCTTLAGAATEADHHGTPTLIPRVARHLIPYTKAPLPRHALLKRDGPDGGPTATITTLVATATVVTLPVTTTTTTSSTIDTTVTVTVTPAIFTTFSGTVQKTVTRRLKTVTSTVRTTTTIVATKTKTKSFKATLTGVPTIC